MRTQSQRPAPRARPACARAVAPAASSPRRGPSADPRGAPAGRIEPTRCPARRAANPLRGRQKYEAGVLRDEKILITGPASQVALPLARELARNNEVFGLARFSRAADRETLEALGVRCIPLDLAEGSLDALPDDFGYVLNFAVVKSADANFDYDLAANAEGAGRLLVHCRSAKAFLHCSSGAVYQYAGHDPLPESAPLGDNHRALFPTYSISKIAAESVVRFAARQCNVPTLIARLSVPYGNNGGWPWFHLMMMKAGQPIAIHPERPNVYNPIHEDDYIAHVETLLQAARVPALTVNWGGSEAVSIEDWCGYLCELTGLEPRFQETESAFGSLVLDLGRMHELVGKTTVSWRDGLRRMVEARNPELLSR
ncbi:MAG: NAD(P)-dependent oxidoreductase [Deltaproteobacteria bacterium]|nr:MAG: NAD(P)-dependent oxidoreductase [Deltaproteobacteria bacterium]